MTRDIIRLRASMLEIAEDAARRHGLTLKDLRIKTQRRAISWPRQEAMAEMHRRGFSHTQIIRFFGLTNHTSSVYAVDAVARRRALARQEAA